MIFLELFLSFLKIGFTSFGGMSMVPLILEEMQIHQWMSAEDMSNLIAIAEMTPGPLGINCATFAGERAAGVMGGIVAVLGVLMPAFTLTVAVAVFFQKFRENALMEKILRVVKPLCISMILVTILELAAENYALGGNLDWPACLIGLLMTGLIIKKKWPVPKVIAVSAVLGIVCYSLLPEAVKIIGYRFL